MGDLTAIKDADIKNPTNKRSQCSIGKRRQQEHGKILFGVGRSKELLLYFKADELYIVLKDIVGEEECLTYIYSQTNPCLGDALWPVEENAEDENEGLSIFVELFLWNSKA